MLAAALLWPLLFVLTAGAAGVVTAARTTHRVEALVIGIPLLAAVLVAGLALWFVLDEFFSAASRVASLVSLSLFLYFLYLFRQGFERLTAVAESGGDMLITLFVAFSLAASFMWWEHGLRLWFLEQDERVIVARSSSRESLKVRLAANLTTWRRSKPLPGSRRAAVLLIAAKMMQGLSAYVSLLFFGCLLFFGTMLPLVTYDVVRGREKLAGCGGTVLATGVALSVMLLISFILTQGAMSLKRIARRLPRYSFKQVVALDTRPQVLFLRSWADDQVILPRLPLYTEYWLAEPYPRLLGNVLIERFSHLGPVVEALKPGDEEESFGPARFPTPADWETSILESAHQALAIVVVVDDTPGIAWETKHMLEPGLVEKTLFLSSPRAGCPDLGSHSELGALLEGKRATRKGFRVLAAYQEMGSWRTLMSKSPTADDYIVACQAFFRRRTG